MTTEEKVAHLEALMREVMTDLTVKTEVISALQFRVRTLEEMNRGADR